MSSQNTGNPVQTPQKEKGKEKKAEGEEEGESSVKTLFNSDHLAIE